MTDKPTAHTPLRPRAPWSPPRVARIAASAAENGLNPIREDGVFSMGS